MTGSDPSPRPDPTPGSEQATIRLLFLNALINELADNPAVLETLLREHGFYRSQTLTPYERAPLHRYISLIERSSEVLNRPFLGLELGARFGLEELGPFNSLLRASCNLRSALESFALFQSRWQTRTLLDVTIGPENTTFSYRIEDHEIRPRRQDAEFTMAGITTIVRQLTTSRWFPVEVHFEHAITGHEKHLTQFFRSPVHGNRVSNQLVIRNVDLDRQFTGAIPSEDSKLRSILQCHLLDLLGPAPVTTRTVAGQAEAIIARRLGQTHVDCDSVAAQLNMSGRSFRRCLMEEQTSFRTLLQTARQERARAMLKTSNIPLSAAAEQLGYSDTATFSRAFKEWTGVSPRRYFKQPQ